MRKGKADKASTNETKRSLKNDSYKELSLNRGRKDGGLWKTCGKPSLETEIADKRAEILIRKFRAPQCRLFFLKCVYHLPEATIENMVEASFRPYIKSNIRYFTVIAKKELEQAGY